jgi:pSer/pThr/pTyr-binding forkhead associated (FHA) protein
MARYDESPAELQARIAAERRGQPFLTLRDAARRQRIVALGDEQAKLRVGRHESSDVCLDWDPKVSGLHATLGREGRFWILQDDGLSTNGSFVNGERVRGTRRLRNGDELCFGATIVTFRDAGTPIVATTPFRPPEQNGPEPSPAQKRVLIALCRPYKQRPAFARPATNQEIADELVLSVEAVKSHLRALFARFDLEAVPQQEKRVRLVEYVMQNELIADHEL